MKRRNFFKAILASLGVAVSGTIAGHRIEPAEEAAAEASLTHCPPVLVETPLLKAGLLCRHDAGIVVFVDPIDGDDTNSGLLPRSFWGKSGPMKSVSLAYAAAVEYDIIYVIGGMDTPDGPLDRALLVTPGAAYRGPGVWDL